MKTAATIGHVHFEDLGAFETVLTIAGYQVCYHDVGIVKFLEDVPVLHWHGDTFDLPEGSELLGSTSICRNQAFRCGKSLHAFQFHPEASAKNFERWLIGRATGISSTTGLSATKLRSDTARFAPESAPLGPQCLREWLQGLH